MCIHPFCGLFIIIVSTCLINSVEAQAQKRHKTIGQVKSLSHIHISFPDTVFGKPWRNNLEFDEETTRVNSSTYLSYAKASSSIDILSYENWFWGMTGGVDLESGAFDGVEFSNSLMFESVFQWTSILVEADRSNYNSLRVKRDSSINIYTALCEEQKTLHYVSGKGTTAGILEYMSPDYISVWHSEKTKDPEAFAKLVSPISCVNLTSLAENLALTRIDLWILDVEGAEEQILRGVDFNKLNIQTIVMEMDGTDPVKDANKLSILNNNGYTCIKSTADVFCTHKNFKPSRKPDALDIAHPPPANHRMRK